MSREINLFTENMQKLYLKFESLEKLKSDLELILEYSDMHSLNFAKRTLFNEEIKTNNLIEGYNDDIEYIDRVVKDNPRRKNAKDEKEQRILNLYNGYKFILNGNDISLENLTSLYKILSRNLLCNYDLEHMGKYFREEPIYIYTSSVLTKEPDRGMDVKNIPIFMDQLLEFINSKHHFDTQTDAYIKSQIIHFYFVYIHPYFDVNGRTSRTLAIWYLLNNQIYPYVLFNRGINFDKNTYYKTILEAKKFGNITIFIKYMLENVKRELEKEYAILEIEKNTMNLTNLERQCINYILSMKGNITVKDFSGYYKKFNEKRKNIDILENMIEPLIDKNIIIPGRETSKCIYGTKPNYFFSLNEEILEEYHKLIRKID